MSLRGQDLTIGEVSSQFDITGAAVPKHLNVLEEGCLISVYPQGRERVTHLEARGINSTEDWFQYFDKFWDEGLSNLKSVIE